MAIRLGSISGIPLKLHATFFLLLGWLALTAAPGQAGLRLAFTALVFACIALHELGHSLTAQRFGIRVQEITLYPFGGVATIDGLPTPKQELMITAAGPLVNLVLAGALWPFIGQHPLLGALLAANLTLFAFNLIPAFPMDGGRIVRALLALRFGLAPATRFAARLGKLMGVLMGLYGLFNGIPMLLVTSVFLWTAANAEVRLAQTTTWRRSSLAAGQAATVPQTLTPGTTLLEAREIMLEAGTRALAVVMGTNMVGLLTREQLLKGLYAHDAYVAGAMLREFPSATVDQPLREIVEQLRQPPHAIAVLRPDGSFVGLLTPESASLGLRRVALMAA